MSPKNNTSGIHVDLKTTLFVSKLTQRMIIFYIMVHIVYKKLIMSCVAILEPYSNANHIKLQQNFYQPCIKALHISIKMLPAVWTLTKIQVFTRCPTFDVPHGHHLNYCFGRQRAVITSEKQVPHKTAKASFEETKAILLILNIHFLSTPPRLLIHNSVNNRDRKSFLNVEYSRGPSSGQIDWGSHELLLLLLLYLRVLKTALLYVLLNRNCWIFW